MVYWDLMPWGCRIIGIDNIYRCGLPDSNWESGPVAFLNTFLAASMVAFFDEDYLFFWRGGFVGQGKVDIRIRSRT